jgi:hypothetical protein
MIKKAVVLGSVAVVGAVGEDPENWRNKGHMNDSLSVR